MRNKVLLTYCMYGDTLENISKKKSALETVKNRKVLKMLA